MAETTAIIISGAAGRMGRAILDAAREDSAIVVAGLCEAASQAGGAADFRGERIPIVAALPRTAPAVVIEFTSPEATLEHVREAVGHGQAVVVGTTGLSGAQVGELEHAARRIPVVYSTNYSVGV